MLGINRKSKRGQLDPLDSLPLNNPDKKKTPSLSSFKPILLALTFILFLYGLYTIFYRQLFFPQLPLAICPQSNYEASVLKIYRYGLIRSLKVSKCMNMDQLLMEIRHLYNDSYISRLTTPVGETLRAVIPPLDPKAKYHIIALNLYEHFVWPATEIGETKYVELEGGERKVKVTTISIKPRVFDIENFLSEEECTHMIQRVKNENLRRSLVGSGNVSNIRTSMQTWIGPGQNNDDPVFTRVRLRAHEFTRMPFELGEDTQVVKYEVNQHYYVHHDYFGPDPTNFVSMNGANRMATIIYYLNDVELGGETAFPYHNSTYHPHYNKIPYGETCQVGGLMVKPQKRGAALFYSLDEIGHMQGTFDEYSLHAGCDVLSGEKWIVNQWIHNKRVKGNLFNNDY